jgi:hypothetical protein
MRVQRRVLLLVVAAAFVVAQTAGAKEGVKATLTTPIDLDAKAGTRLDVAWRLWSLDQKGRRRPFGAGDVFVRLRSATGGAPREAFAAARGDAGEYRASVTVPAGGIGAVEIGLRGFASSATGRRRADVLFPVTNGPALGAAPTSGTDNGWETWAATLVAAALCAAVVCAAGVVRRVRRRRPAPPPVIDA